jgi:hypothetical protein
LHGNDDVDFLVDGHATVARHAYLLEQLVVELGVDGEHEYLVYGRHCLYVRFSGCQMWERGEAYLHHDLFLQVERGTYDGDCVILEVTTVRGEGGVHRDELF